MLNASSEVSDISNAGDMEKAGEASGALDATPVRHPATAMLCCQI